MNKFLEKALTLSLLTMIYFMLKTQLYLGCNTIQSTLFGIVHDALFESS